MCLHFIVAPKPLLRCSLCWFSLLDALSFILLNNIIQTFMFTSNHQEALQLPLQVFSVHPKPCSLHETPLPGLAVDIFRYHLAPPGTARHSLARSRPMLPALAWSNGTSLGRWSLAWWRRAGDANIITEQLKQPTRHRWWGDPLPHRQTGAGIGLCVRYITEAEGLHCLNCPGDLQFLCVQFKKTLSHDLLYMRMEMIKYTNMYTLWRCGEKLSEMSECLPTVSWCTFCGKHLLFSISLIQAKGGTIIRCYK